MSKSVCLRLSTAFAVAALLFSSPVEAQDNGDWSPDNYRSGRSTYGSQGGGSEGYGSSGSSGSQSYDAAPSHGGYSSGNSNYSGGSGSYQGRGSYAAGGDSYAPGTGGGNYGGANDAYSPAQSGGYGSGDAYSSSRGGYGGGNDAYAPSRSAHNYTDPGRPVDDGGSGGYGAPYSPPPAGGEAYRDAPPPSGEGGRYYEQNEIVAAGHGFFGAISKGLAEAVEYAFKSEGRPNGYILGEDAGGAFVVGLRYGEGRLFTKDAGDHKVFWQGPSVGYDAGAAGSKTMVLVYNMHDPSEIYNRFGGAEGSAYVVGGVSVQFQKYNDVTLAIIRSGIGLRLGANVGYLKYTRAPTWNPL